MILTDWHKPAELSGTQTECFILSGSPTADGVQFQFDREEDGRWCELNLSEAEARELLNRLRSCLASGGKRK